MGRKTAATVLWAGLMLLLLGAAAPASGLTPAATGEPPGQRIRVHRTPTGLVVQEVTVGDSVLTTYGGSAPSIESIEVSAHSAGASIAIPAAGSDTSTDYEKALAAGLSAEQACAFVQQAQDPDGCVTSAQLSAHAVQAKRAKPLRDWCWKFVTYKGDGSKHNYGCTEMWTDSIRRKIRYVGATMQSTGWSVDPGLINDRLSGVGIQLRYRDSGAHAIRWSPHSTVETGSCRSFSTTVTSPRTGVQYTQGGQRCPERITPFHSPAFQWFGSKWLSDDAISEDERRGTIASSLTKIPRGGSTSATLYLWLRWE